MTVKVEVPPLSSLHLVSGTIAYSTLPFQLASGAGIRYIALKRTAVIDAGSESLHGLVRRSIRRDEYNRPRCVRPRGFVEGHP